MKTIPSSIEYPSQGSESSGVSPSNISESQQLTYPLDSVSLNILQREGFIRFVGAINNFGVGGVKFPFAFIVNVDGVLFYLPAFGTLYRYTVNSSTLTVVNNPFKNGNAVHIYTDNQQPAPLVAGGAQIYFVKNVSGNTFGLSLTVVAIFTVSGVTTSPTASAVYTDGRLNSFTVVSTSLSGSPTKHGTITFSGNFSNSFPSGTLTKVSGTGDSTISYSAVSFNGGTAITLTSAGVGDQFIAPA